MTEGKQIEDKWFYYPELRKHLAEVSLSDKNLPNNIQHLEDLFFFRYFYGQISKESNVYDRSISDYAPKTITEEALRIEMELVDSEHKFWKDLAPRNN